MSYILEALKKSDQQRQRGATPKLPTEQEPETAAKQLSYVYYGVIAATVLCVGIAIGWLRPWQTELPVNAAEPDAARLPISNLVAPTTSQDESVMSRKSEQKISTPETATAVQRVPVIAPPRPETTSFSSHGTVSAVIAAPVLPPKKHDSPSDAPQEQKVISFAELPMTLQQEIPVMAIQLHSYSSNPANSLVSINSRMMKEGESLMPGLKLEQITPDGVIFSYKGYRFKHGIW